MDNLSFDSPKSGSDYLVHVTGTAEAGKIPHVIITVTVTNGTTHRNDVFYQAYDMKQSDGSQSHATYGIAIIPEIGGDNVKSDIGWSIKQ